MARRFRFVAGLALLVAATAGLTACGDSQPDAAGLLKDAFGPNHSVKSGNLDVKLVLDANGLKSLKGPVALSLAGPFESQGKGKVPKVDLGLKISGSGANFTAGAVSTGDAGWLEVQGTPFAVDATSWARFKQQYEASASKSKGSGQTLSSLGVNPLRWLKDPKIAGTEQSGGADTYRVTASVDVSAFLDDVSTLLDKAGSLGSSAAGVPSKLTAAQRVAIASSVKDAGLQVWVGKDDKTLRRVKIDVDIDVPKAFRSRAGGLSTGTLTFDLAINDLNKPQTITPPKNARPLSDLKRLIAAQAAGQNGTAPSTPTTTTPSAPSSGGSQYLNCVNKAGTNVRAMQKCAALVGQ